MFNLIYSKGPLFFYKFAGRNDGDGTAVLSGNSIVGEKTNQTNDTETTETKLLLFNGLYFRGSWATPFQVF